MAGPYAEIAEFILKDTFPAVPVARVKELRELCASTPVFALTPDRYIWSRVQWMNRGYEQYAKLQELKNSGFSDDEILTVRRYIGEAHSISLHFDVVVKSLELFCSKEQYDLWVPAAKALQLIGCYAQTELGCGSDVRGLQTTATFDPARDEFELNTPTLAATKWWIGVLSKTSTHALVFARVLSKGKDYGPHPFFLRIRDPNSHEPLPGISIGDIGPKFGFAMMDNGYMAFKQVKVPRLAMLSRFSSVTPAGEYELLSPEAPKLLYLAMLSTRCFIARAAWLALAKGVAIAVKYSNTRTQFKTVTEDPGRERRLMDYQMQQRKLLPLMATTYGMIFGGAALSRAFETLTKQIAQEDVSLLREVHVLACACKSFYTWTQAEGLEACRMSCGGHGFSAYSGLPMLYVNALPGCTYEGDNSLLCLQVAQFLAKTIKKKQEATPRFAFLVSKAEQQPAFLPESAATQLACMRAIILHYATFLSSREDKALARKLTRKEVWSKALQVSSVPATKAVCWLFTLEEFVQAVSRCSPSATESLDLLRQVFGLHLLYEHRGLLIRIGSLTAEQAGQISSKHEEKLRAVKEHSEAYADSFGFSEGELCSALVCRDGNVYEKILNWVQTTNPISAKTAFPGVLKHLKPLAKL